MHFNYITVELLYIVADSFVVPIFLKSELDFVNYVKHNTYKISLWHTCINFIQLRNTNACRLLERLTFYDVCCLCDDFYSFSHHQIAYFALTQMSFGNDISFVVKLQNLSDSHMA